MRQRRGLWLVFAAVLFGLAAWLMLSGQGEEQTPPPKRVEFPKRLRDPESQRVERRRTYVAPVAVAVANAGPAEPVRPRDPVLAALPRGQGKSAVIIEANALRHSPLGEMLLECLMRRGRGQLERFKQETGVDPLQDLDRLVLSDDGIILSGNFSDPRLQQALRGDTSTSYDYGQQGRLFEPPARPERANTHVRFDRPPIGLWNNQMLVFGDSVNGLKEVLDRVEGRGPQEPPVFNEAQTYGEMYGVLSVEQLRKLLPPEQQELAARLGEVAEKVELHVDASTDFAMTAQVKGMDAQKLADLGKSLGGALSLARMNAQTQGNTRLAQLLEFAKVRPNGNTFSLDVAVPLDVIQQQLSFCREREDAPTDAPESEPR
jgi:hypothetical protein